MQNLSNQSSSNTVQEAERLFTQAKDKISPTLSQREKNDYLCELEGRITSLFETSSPILEENHSFEAFAEKCTASNPSLKIFFSDLLFHLNSAEEIIDFHLNTLTPDSNL